MADPYVRELGRTEDIDGMDFIVGVDYDSVSINGRRLDSVACEQFARLFIRACWEAGVHGLPPQTDDMR